MLVRDIPVHKPFIICNTIDDGPSTLLVKDKDSSIWTMHGFMDGIRKSGLVAENYIKIPPDTEAHLVDINVYGI